VILNGIDLAPYAPPPPDRSAVRAELGLFPADFVLIQVARLDYLKDHATALRVLDRVRRANPSVRLVLVGEGPEWGPIEDLIDRLELRPFVRLLGLRRDVPRLLAAADVFLLTSVSEGIPLTVIEAMASGLPVVATRVGGLPEVVEEGTTGLLAPAGDAAGLGAHALTLAADPELRARMGRRGRQRAVDVFSEAGMVAAYRDAYAELVRD
jgi:glycosyltransferase involved in cell wall biosynthesis